MDSSNLRGVGYKPANKTTSTATTGKTTAQENLTSQAAANKKAEENLRSPAAEDVGTSADVSNVSQTGAETSDVTMPDEAISWSCATMRMLAEVASQRYSTPHEAAAGAAGAAQAGSE